MRQCRRGLGIVAIVVLYGSAVAAYAENAKSAEASSSTAVSAKTTAPAVAQPAFSAKGLSPAARLTYASILFYQARRVMTESGDQAKMSDAFRQVERELTQALKDAGQEPDPRTQKLVGSQSAFMLGDLSVYVFKDPAKAKAYYQNALKFFPEHDGAIEALKRL